jgi:hypothetical protein
MFTLGWNLYKGASMAYHEIERKSTQQKFEKQISELKAQIAALIAERESHRDQLAAIIELKEAPKKFVLPKTVTKKERDRAAAVAVASDWHVEETIQAAAVNGLNEFNLKIAERRVDRFFRGIVRLTEIERAGIEIDTLILFLGGDLMTGYIHEELQESNGLSPTQTMLWLYERIYANLDLIKREGKFKRIVIPCCFGNHGRTTKKSRVSTAAANSYEWLLYKFLERTRPDFEWIVADSYLVYSSVFDRIIRWHHGDGIVYRGGVGGLSIPTEKKIAKWNTAKVADLDVFGHYHQYQQNPKWCSNGSLIGYGPYSITIGAGYEPPQQTFFLFDERRGRTCTWPIFCEASKL